LFKASVPHQIPTLAQIEFRTDKLGTSPASADAFIHPTDSAFSPSLISSVTGISSTSQNYYKGFQTINFWTDDGAIRYTYEMATGGSITMQGYTLGWEDPIDLD